MEYTFTDLNSGNYEITVVDANGCQSESMVVVPEVENALNVVVSSLSGCYGVDDGIVTLTVNGGYPPYQYSLDAEHVSGWTDATEYVFEGIATGSYMATVTDSHSCMTSEPVVLEESRPMELVVNYKMNDRGEGGEVSLSVKGGSPKYTYSWSNDIGGSESTAAQYDTVHVFKKLTPALYDFYVSDGTGCQKAVTLGIGENTGISFEILGDTTWCEDETGTLYVSRDDMVVYRWNNNETTQAIEISDYAGTYTYTVFCVDEDGNSGTASKTVTIVDCEEIYNQVAIIGEDYVCYGDSITLTAVTGPFEHYSWNTGATTQSIVVKGDEVGTKIYSVMVSDDSGHYGYADFEVEVGWCNDLTIYPNPANDVLHVNSSDVIGDYIIVNDMDNIMMKGTRIDKKSFDIDTQHLSSGHYLISIYLRDMNKILVYPLIVQH